MGAADTRCGVPLGAARFSAGERDDGAGERERVRDDGLSPSGPSSGAIALATSWGGGALPADDAYSPRVEPKIHSPANLAAARATC